MIDPVMLTGGPRNHGNLAGVFLPGQQKSRTSMPIMENRRSRRIRRRLYASNEIRRRHSCEAVARAETASWMLFMMFVLPPSDPYVSGTFSSGRETHAHAHSSMSQPLSSE